MLSLLPRCFNHEKTSVINTWHVGTLQPLMQSVRKWTLRWTTAESAMLWPLIRLQNHGSITQPELPGSSFMSHRAFKGTCCLLTRSSFTHANSESFPIYFSPEPESCAHVEHRAFSRSDGRNTSAAVAAENVVMVVGGHWPERFYSITQFHTV